MRRAFILAVALGLTACHAPAAHGPRGFTVEVALTPAAAAKLSSLHEKVAVAAYYYGLPAPGVPANQDGQVDLGSEKMEFTPPQDQVHFSGAVVDEGDLTTIAGPPRVLINVFSARHAVSDNLLDCSTFEDTIATARARTPHITCDLIKS
jgi:hypothetical protein